MISRIYLTKISHKRLREDLTLQSNQCWRHTTWHNVMPGGVTSYNVALRHTTWHYVIPRGVTSCHVTLYHMAWRHTTRRDVTCRHATRDAIPRDLLLMSVPLYLHHHHLTASIPNGRTASSRKYTNHFLRNARASMWCSEKKEIWN